MTTESLKEAIKRELPTLLREDRAFRAYVLDLTRQEYAPRVLTEDWFERLLREMQRDREAQARKWDEQNRKWDEQSREQARKWEEHNREQALKWDEQNRKWDEQNRKWDEQNRKWDEVHAELRREREEQARKWDEVYAELGRDREEQARKWDASQREFDRVHDEIMAEAKKVDRSIGALGARWGMQSEAAFRNALAGILEQHFGVQVLHVDDYDDDGTVFGRPDQVEIDIIIKNGLLLICELKSSMSKSDMYIFERKARFYERHHDRNADRLLVISPMIDAKAKKVAHQLGIETYCDSEDVEEI